MDKSQVFTIEYDFTLEKWVVFARIGSLKIHVDNLTKKQVGNWFKKIKNEEKRK